MDGYWFELDWGHSILIQVLENLAKADLITLQIDNKGNLKLTLWKIRLGMAADPGWIGWNMCGVKKSSTHIGIIYYQVEKYKFMHKPFNLYRMIPTLPVHLLILLAICL